MIDIQTISLRERKHAQTKVALARQFMERMKTKRLSEISVKEVCETIPISEVTFYNYFPEKTDIFVYIMHLWHLEMQWKLLQWEREKNNLEIVQLWFDAVSQEAEEYPVGMNEVLSFISQQTCEVVFKPMSLAEKVLAFPAYDGIEQLDVSGTHDDENSMVRPYITQAISCGELPAHTDVEDVHRMLDAMFLGGLMTLHNKERGTLGSFYRKMLKFFWQGLKADTQTVSDDVN